MVLRFSNFVGLSRHLRSNVMLLLGRTVSVGVSSRSYFIRRFFLFQRTKDAAMRSSYFFLCMACSIYDPGRFDVSSSEDNVAEVRRPRGRPRKQTPTAAAFPVAPVSEEVAQSDFVLCDVGFAPHSLVAAALKRPRLICERSDPLVALCLGHQARRCTGKMVEAQASKIGHQKFGRQHLSLASFVQSPSRAWVASFCSRLRMAVRDGQLRAVATCTCLMNDCTTLQVTSQDWSRSKQSPDDPHLFLEDMGPPQVC